jgi:hypothetical protein
MKEHMVLPSVSGLLSFLEPWCFGLYCGRNGEVQGSAFHPNCLRNKPVKLIANMTKSLRKRHLQIWSSLLVLLPMGIVLAKLVVPNQPVNVLLQPAASILLPNIVGSIENEQYSVNLRSSNDSTYQLQWVNKNTLTYPTATIYMAPAGVNEIAKSNLVGRIEARGTYVFPIRANTLNKHMILYDFIHQQIIDTLNLKP